jgi:hypothetical protein
MRSIFVPSTSLETCCSTRSFNFRDVIAAITGAWVEENYGYLNSSKRVEKRRQHAIDRLGCTSCARKLACMHLIRAVVVQVEYKSSIHLCILMLGSLNRAYDFS